MNKPMRVTEGVYIIGGPQITTVVCITKFPDCIYNEPYAGVLKKYDHVFAHVTITGLGGTPLEPNVPGWRDAIGQLPGLVEFLGAPERIRLRVDPLVAVKKNGTLISNIPVAEQIIERAAKAGIRCFSTSFMEEYPRVQRRLAGHGYEIMLQGLHPGKEQLNGFLQTRKLRGHLT